MPGRNIVKFFEPESYHHVYNRGVSKSKIFHDDEDYAFFEWLLERSLGPKPAKDSKGRDFTWHRERVELNAYCLMPTHYHLLLFQDDEHGVELLMKTLGAAYTAYFNKKYQRRGPLFENVYRAVPIVHDDQLLHISRYIHLNHRQFRNWVYSSYADYLVTARPWIETGRIMSLFDSAVQYRQFVDDYEALHRELDALKHNLADY